MTFLNADRKLAALLLFSLLLTYSLFLQAPTDDNVVSRAAVALSIVQDGTLSIDRFEEFTGDKAYFHDRFYSDKAPGMALLALPVVYATRFALEMLGRDGPVIKKGKLTHFMFYVYASTVLTSGLFTAVAAATLFLTARSLGATQVGALFGALSYGVGTPAFGWATAFFGHATAGACLFLAFAALVALERESPSSRHALALGCCAGGGAWSGYDCRVHDSTGRRGDSAVCAARRNRPRTWQKMSRAQICVHLRGRGVSPAWDIQLFCFWITDAPWL